MIYFDNAATSFPKPKCVIQEVKRCIEQYCGNPGRSAHRMSLAAADKIFETREIISDFVGNKNCENIVFTPNATYALNLVIKGLIDKKCHCIISDCEHNSVIRPLIKSLKKHGGDYSIFNSDLPLNKGIEPLIRDDTDVIISTLCSNVTGRFIKIDELSKIAKRNNLKLILDASQYLGHSKLNLTNVYYTALCSAGHKGLFGIQGSAFAIINDCKLFDTLTEGGSGVDSFSETMPQLLPERYESGTLPTPAIVSLGAGIKHISSIGIDTVERKIEYLTNILIDELSAIPNLTLFGANSGIASFNLRDLPSSYVSEFLDRNNIATRSGFHCSPLIHKKLGTEERGAVRVSLSYFNTENEIYELIKILRKI